jgi:hypothetical protein
VSPTATQDLTDLAGSDLVLSEWLDGEQASNKRTHSLTDELLRLPSYDSEATPDPTAVDRWSKFIAKVGIVLDIRAELLPWADDIRDVQNEFRFTLRDGLTDET